MPDPPENAAPQRVPPESLRRIDWLALAPWVLLFRCPAACLGWPLAFGAIGAAIVGWPNADAGVPALDFDNVAETAVEMVARFGNATPLQLAIWPLIGVFIAAAAAGPLTGAPSLPALRVITMWPKRALRVVTTAGLLLAPAAGLIACLRVFAAGLGLPGLGAALAVAYPFVFWLLAIPAGMLLLLALAGIPLTIAAVCVDDADAFDAASRTVAYTSQRVLLLSWYVLIAVIVAVVSAMVVELLLSAADTLAGRVGIIDALRGPNGDLLHTTRAVSIRAVRGFYPAYLFTAATAIYLLLRHDIDGQPLDEMAGAPDQGAA